MNFILRFFFYYTHLPPKKHTVSLRCEILQCNKTKRNNTSLHISDAPLDVICSKCDAQLE